MDQITIGDLEALDFERLLEMGRKLWTGFNEVELSKLIKEATGSNKYRILMAKDPVGKCLGFSIFSIRTDYVEGAVKSPTGYLEGIFVEQEFRKKGIAKEFILMGELWCKEHGCDQMGSDTWITDKRSREFHKKVGFWEEEEVVHFLKDIK